MSHYVTLSELQTWASRTQEPDANLEGALERAETRIDTYTRRTFAAPADGSRIFYPDRSGLVLLDGDLYHDTDTPAAVQVDDVLTTAFTWRPLNRNPRYALALDDPPGIDAKVTIRGRWAYSITAPEDIRQAVMRLAIFYWRQRSNMDDSGMIGVEGVGVVKIPAGEPADVLNILRPYRRTAF